MIVSVERTKKHTGGLKAWAFTQFMSRHLNTLLLLWWCVCVCARARARAAASVEVSFT